MKSVKLLGGALVVVALLAGCGAAAKKAAAPPPPSTVLAPAFPPGSTMERIQRAGKISVGVRFDQPGFGFKDPASGELSGFDIEIAKLIAQGIFGGTEADAATKVNWVETAVRDREQALQQGTVDMVVSAYTITEARKALVSFAGPYYVAHGDVMVRADANVTSLDALDGKKVCTVNGSTYQTTLQQKAPAVDLSVRFDTYGKCVDALRTGVVEGVATDNALLAGLITMNAGMFKLAGLDYTDEPYGIGLKKDDAAFEAFLDQRLRAVEAVGEWRTAFDATLGRLGIAVQQPPAIVGAMVPLPTTSSTTAPALTTMPGVE